MRKNLNIICLCLILQVLFGWALSRTYLLFHNNLYNNHNWLCTKTTLEKGTMGAIAFMSNQQPLAKGRLNLGSWYGFNELLYKEKLNTKKVDFDFSLEENGYLNLIFNKNESGYSGIRLSVSKHFDSLFFKSSSIGEFLKKVDLSLPELKVDQWQHLTLSSEGKGMDLSLDGKVVVSLEETFMDDCFIGFRGGQRNVYIDSIVIRQRDSGVIYENFNHPQNTILTTVIIILSIVFLNIIVMVFLLKFICLGIRPLAMRVAVVNIVLSFLALLLYGYQYVEAKSYPLINNDMLKVQKYWAGSKKKEIFANIKKIYGPKGEENIQRILFLGSSQTWGAGALREDETFVRQFEKNLNRSSSSNISFECINAGVSSLTSSNILNYLEKELISLKPDIIVINLSNNDIETASFKENMDLLASNIISAHIKPIFILEPNSIERTPKDSRHGDLSVKHDIMKKIASTYRIHVVDMHAYLLSRRDDGFLWWDFVHLTSFGQKLFADYLCQETSDIINL